ncbi:MAG: hypothetical protein WBW69_16135 [Candidatus Korobacteraceae bacterium]
MPELFLHVSEAGAVLNQQAGERMPQVVNPESTKASVLDRRQEHTLV